MTVASRRPRVFRDPLSTTPRWVVRHAGAYPRFSTWAAAIAHANRAAVHLRTMATPRDVLLPEQ